MKHPIKLAIVLVITWLLLSDFFEPLLLSLGVVSVAFSLWIATRMDKFDNERYRFNLSLSFIKFLFSLGIKVIQSNIDVCARILGFKPVESTFITIQMPFKDDVAKVLYANAITLTPGSSSIALEDKRLLVHTISKEGAHSLAHGDMLKIMPKNFTVDEIETLPS